MSDEEKVPDDWKQTADHSPVSDWIGNIHCPMGGSKEELLLFLTQKKDPELQHFVVESEDDLPQSFAHWWVYMRDARRTALARHDPPDNARPFYPTLAKWLPVVEGWMNQVSVTHADIFGMFQAWLEILCIDMAVYDNEDQRTRVPRRLDDDIVWKDDSSEEDQPSVQSRQNTMQFIICEGLNIMQERGWTVGYHYWKESCQKYLVFT